MGASFLITPFSAKRVAAISLSSPTSYSSTVLNKYLLTLVSALLCLTLGCNEGGGAQTQLPAKGRTTSAQAALLPDDKDTYAVYDALLGVSSKDDASKSSDAITILNHTKIGVSCSDISMTIDPRRLTAGRDFSQQNSVERLLIPDSFKLSRKVNMVSSAELDRIFANGPKGWPAFHTAYPGTHGYIELSAVGFSPGKNFAVVYSAVHCGPLCGAGGFVTLSKSGGVWRKDTDRLCSWIS
jgi:hypothetical protein